MKKTQNWIGIDVAKASFDVGLLLNGNKVFKEIQLAHFPRTEEGFHDCMRWVKQCCDDSEQIVDDPLRVVLDSTGYYSMQLVSWIFKNYPELKPSIINPSQLKYFGAGLALRNKTDEVDARKHALFGYERQPRPYDPLDPHYMELRELNRQRTTLREELVSARNRASCEVVTLSVRRVQKSHINHLEKLIARIEDRIKKVVNSNDQLKNDVKLLLSIPGIGLISATVILGEFGDLRRFGTAREISAFSGLSPSRYQSGKKEKRSRISRKGPSHLRYKLYMPALASTRGDNDLARVYNRLVENGKPKKSALCAVMRKLVVLSRSIIVNQVPYENNFEQKRRAKNEFQQAGISMTKCA